MIQGGTNGIEADGVWILSNDGTIRGGSEGSGDDGDHGIRADDVQIDSNRGEIRRRAQMTQVVLDASGVADSLETMVESLLGGADQGPWAASARYCRPLSRHSRDQTR